MRWRRGSERFALCGGAAAASLRFAALSNPRRLGGALRQCDQSRPCQLLAPVPCPQWPSLAPSAVPLLPYLARRPLRRSCLVFAASSASSPSGSRLIISAGAAELYTTAGGRPQPSPASPPRAPCGMLDLVDRQRPSTAFVVPPARPTPPCRRASLPAVTRAPLPVPPHCTACCCERRCCRCGRWSSKEEQIPATPSRLLGLPSTPQASGSRPVTTAQSQFYPVRTERAAGARGPRLQVYWDLELFHVATARCPSAQTPEKFGLGPPSSKGRTNNHAQNQRKEPAVPYRSPPEHGAAICGIMYFVRPR